MAPPTAAHMRILRCAQNAQYRGGAAASVFSAQHYYQKHLYKKDISQLITAEPQLLRLRR